MKLVIDLAGIKAYIRYLTITLPIGINLMIYINLYRKIKAYCERGKTDYLRDIKYYLDYSLTVYEVFAIILDLLILIAIIILVIIWAWSLP